MSRSAGIERVLTNKVNQRVLRWFGHIKRMDEYSIVDTGRRVLMADVSGEQVQSRFNGLM